MTSHSNQPKFSLIIILSFIVYSSNIQSQVNLFLNGDLESWTSSNSPNTTPDSWNNCSTDGVGVDCVPYSCGAVPLSGSNGAIYARGFNGEGFSQDVPTTIGETYNVEFDFSGVSNCFGGASNSGWDVEVNGLIAYTSPVNSNNVWETTSFSFVATTTLTTVCFRRIPFTGIGTQGGIDNLKLFQVCSQTSSELVVSSCNSYISPSGSLWETTGNYQDTILNVNGCDSVISISLTINTESFSSQDQTSLDSYTWPVNGQTYTQSGQYNSVITNIAGCDSTITLNLTLSFTGIDDNIKTDVLLFPNPAKDFIVINVPENLSNSIFEIIDNSGRIVKKGTLMLNEQKIELTNLLSGVYYFKVNNSTGYLIRVIVL
jgi:hypothetical protein